MKRVLLASLLLVSGCITPGSRPPIPQTPPAGPVRMHLTVVTAAREQVPALVANLTVDTRAPVACAYDLGGLQILCVAQPPGWGAWLELSAPGYQSRRLRIAELVPDPPPFEVRMESDVVAMPRLVVRGQFLGLETGERFTVIEATDFALYHKFLDGGNASIALQLQQRQEVGFNTVRIFGMGFPGHFVPAEYGERYYTELPAFYQLLAKYGLYGEFTVFAGAREVIPASAAQLAHFARMVQALTPITNALLEAINEADQPSNTLDSLQQLPRPPPPLLSSHGSNGSQAIPVQPYWDYATFHTNGAPEWVRKVGHNAFELWAGPTIANENTRAPDAFSLAQEAYDAAAGGALLPAGSCFHSVSGRTSDLWGGLELELAKGWVSGALSVPLNCHDGAYRHRDDLEGASYLRVYQRGTTDACIVRIRK